MKPNPKSSLMEGSVYVANQLVSDKATIVEIEITIPARGNKPGKVTLPMFVGTATRHPDDPQDAQIGYELALGRALRKAGRQLISDGNNKSRKAGRGRRIQQKIQTEPKSRTLVEEARELIRALDQARVQGSAEVIGANPDAVTITNRENNDG